MPSGRSASISRCVLCQMGTARTSKLRPFAVRVVRRLRRSVASAATLTRPRRCNGLRAAVNVVRSIARRDATAAIPGASGRFRDIISENCPLVRPSGRRASSKRRASALAARCTCRQRQESRTSSVVSKEGWLCLLPPGRMAFRPRRGRACSARGRSPGENVGHFSLRFIILVSRHDLNKAKTVF